MNKGAFRAVQMSRNAARTAQRNQTQVRASQQKIRTNMQRTTAIGASQAHQEQMAHTGTSESKSGLGTAVIGGGVGAFLAGPIGALIGAAVGWVAGKVR